MPTVKNLVKKFKFLKELQIHSVSVCSFWAIGPIKKAGNVRLLSNSCLLSSYMLFIWINIGLTNEKRPRALL